MDKIDLTKLDQEDYGSDVLQQIDSDATDSEDKIKAFKESRDVTAPTTGKTLEYGKSRWDFEKARGLKNGRYHYDSKVKDKIDDVLMFHGNIDMDCDHFINKYKDAAVDNAVHWATRNKSVGGHYAIDQETHDIVRAGGDPEGKFTAEPTALLIPQVWL